jgi:DNA polymerase (family 10)
MTNAEIARILNHIARILSIQGENPFKIRAYEKAAQTIEGLAGQLAEWKDRQKVNELPGIGEALAKKITELLATGRLRFYEDLLKTDHARLVEFLDIPGMGPKHARLVYDALGLCSVAELRQAAEKGRLRQLPGLGPKAEQKILDGILQLQKYKTRHPLAVIDPMAQVIQQQMQRVPQVQRCLLAGSLRRMKETIADVDLLVSADDVAPVMAAFAGLPQAKRVLAAGDTKASIRTAEGIQVDLRVVPEASFGAAAHYFTGSKAHNIRIRALAAEKGLRVNEYGIFNGEHKIGGQHEEEVFKALGLPLIAPEMREDQGEIEAAQSGSLPILIQASDLRGDLHVHSDWSDGGSSIEEMGQEAIKRGYRYLAICDHSPHLGITHGLTPKRLREQGRLIERLNGQFADFRLLKGIEVDILADGTLDLADEVLAELDVVVASVHSNFDQPAAAMTRRIVRAIEHPQVDIIGHLTGRLIGRREPYDLDFEAILSACRRWGKVLELNAHPERLDLSDQHCRRAKQRGVKLAISTDAHRAADLGLMRFGLGTARRGWIAAQDVINTLEYASLKEFLERP